MGNYTTWILTKEWVAIEEICEVELDSTDVQIDVNFPYDNALLIIYQHRSKFPLTLGSDSTWKKAVYLL